MKIKVSDLIVEYLQRIGIKYVFGMPGAHILPVYDSLYNSPIKTVLAKHEQGASFMACGYARATGNIAACITTAGPGATNLVTGIANAYADKQPVLIITGETSTHIFGKGGLQESTGEGGSIDQYELFRSITRYSRVIERTDYIANVLNRVTTELFSNTTGPVLLSIPFNVQQEEVDDEILNNIRVGSAQSHENCQSKQINEAVALIEEANQPVIIAGYGCIKSSSEKLVDTLSSNLNIPVTSSLKAKGTISEVSERSLGSLGVTSYSGAYRYIVDHSDLLIFLGASFNERTSYLWKDELLANKKIIQIDIDYSQLEKVFNADVAIHGDIQNVLTLILQELEKNGAERKSFIPSIANEAIDQDIKDESDIEIFHHKFDLVEKFFSKLSGDLDFPVQVFDDNIIFAQNFYKVTRGSKYYPNSGVSSLGHAIPAAIGARIENDLPAIVIIGDGGFQMCCMEIMTAVNYNIPLTIIMFNNSTMGLIRKNQFQKYEERYIDCDFINPDYEKLASSFGINYFKVNSSQDIDNLFSSVDFKTSINLVDFYIDKNLFPNYVTNR